MNISRDKTNSVVYAIAIFIALFHFYFNIFGGLNTLWFNIAHFSLISLVGFLTFNYKGEQGKPITVLDIVLSILPLFVLLYVVLFEDSLYTTSGSQMRTSDIIAALAVFVISLEIARRTSGNTIPFMSIFCVAYVLWFGKYIDGSMGFAGVSFERLMYKILYTDDGLFGDMATLSATSVFMFVLFASFLLKSGAGDFIINLSKIVAGRFRGGTAQVAIFSSALMGSVSGSTVANVVTTGSITIPMMKKSGFSSIFAGAIEAASSVGSQIMPPVMGAGAFIMSQFTGIPYITIVSVSFLPAILYYISLSIYVYIYAKKNNIGEVNEKILATEIVREGAHFLIPIFLLITLLFLGYTPVYAAGISIISIILASYLTKTKRMTLKSITDALVESVTSTVTVGVLLITVGIVVGTISMSGIGVALSQQILSLSGNNLIGTLILITIASSIVGAGLPASAAYIIIAVVAAPALLSLMLPPEAFMLFQAGVTTPEITMYLLTAHLIIFWLSQDSNLSPPVCLPAFVAANIAGSSPMRTGFLAWKFGKGLYIVPLLFAYTPLITGTLLDKIQVCSFSLIGLVAFAIVMEGFWNIKTNLFERCSLAVASVMLFARDYLIFNVTPAPYGFQYINILGLIIFIGVIMLHNTRYKSGEI